MAATMEAEPVTDDQVTKARRTVVHQAMRANPDDMDVAITQAIETMKMLGIHSSQTPFTSPLLAPTVLNSMSSPSPVVRQK